MPSLIQRITTALATIFVLGYAAIVLSVECLPLADLYGQPEAASRWEYWFVVAADPYAIWLSWTAGSGVPYLYDRLPIFGLAFVWLLLARKVGRGVMYLDGILAREWNLETDAMAVLVGASMLSSMTFLWGTLLGTQRIGLWCMLLVTMLFILAWVNRFDPRRLRLSENKEQLRDSEDQTNDCTEVMADQDTFATSWRRRLFGLLVVSNAFIIGLIIYGASVPTCDAEVRETDWIAIKDYYQTGSIHSIERHSETNGPKSPWMASLAAISFVHQVFGTNSDSASMETQSEILRGMIVGKVVNASLTVLAIVMVCARLSRMFGALAALLTLVTILTMPGLVELTRLGRIEMGSIGWGLALFALNLRLLESWRSGTGFEKWSGILTVLSLVGGAYGCGQAIGLFFAVPPAIWFVYHRTKPSVTELDRIVVYKRRSRLELGCIFLFMLLSMAQLGWILVGSGGMNNLDLTVQSSWFDDIVRWLWRSSALSLVLLPVACVGVCVQARESRGWVVWIPCLFAIAWWIIWCWMGSGNDRNWIGSLLWLAWPAAAGYQWFLKRGGAWSVLPIAAFAVVWSLVVLPIWPLSDNRILASIDEIQRPCSELSNREIGSDRYQAFLNSSLDNSARVLILGDCNVFDVRIANMTNSPMQPSLLDDLADASDLPSRWHEVLREKEITHLVFAWSQLRSREPLGWENKEAKYRSMIQQMLDSDVVSPVPWQGSSSEGDIFQVNR